MLDYARGGRERPASILVGAPEKAPHDARRLIGARDPEQVPVAHAHELRVVPQHLARALGLVRRQSRTPRQRRFRIPPRSDGPHHGEFV